MTQSDHQLELFLLSFNPDRFSTDERRIYDNKRLEWARQEGK